MMAPDTIMETNFYPSYDTDRLHCNLKNREKGFIEKPTLQINPYDAVLRNDPKFLNPIRILEKKYGFVTPIRWMNTFLITTFHLLTVYLTIHIFFIQTERIKWPTIFFGKF